MKIFKKCKSIIVLLVICLGMCMFMKPVCAEAKTYSRKQIQRELKKTKKEYKKLQKKARKYTKGAKACVFAKVISSDPCIIYANKSRYWVTNPRNKDFFYGSFTGWLKTTGDYYSYNGYTCAEAKIVRIPNKLSKKMNKLSKQMTMYESALKAHFAENITALYVCDGVQAMEPGNTVKGMYTTVGLTKYNKVKWKSSNSKVVRVDAAGKISAISEGTATISGTISVSNKKVSYQVVVLRAVQSMDVEQRQITVTVGQTYQIAPIINPSNANEGLVYEYDSSDFSVDANGVITALQVGGGTILVKPRYNIYRNQPILLYVTVEKPHQIRPIDIIEIGNPDDRLDYPGDTCGFDFNANSSVKEDPNYKPVYDGVISVESDNPDVVSVQMDSSDGLSGTIYLRANAAGTATITIKSNAAVKQITYTIEDFDW